jgi:outer membrane protein assembly factor BamD
VAVLLKREQPPKVVPKRESGVKTLSRPIIKAGGKRLAGFLCLAVLGGLFLPGCLFHRKRHVDLASAVNPGDQPDKILYEKATNEIKHGRYDVGRLTLQTLLNTYPDSEYLAKAKLAIADSYYEQGGVSGLTQSEAEYKDFITFFPTAPEAPMAQYRVGMAHFRLMAKADRDQTEAHLAEAELKEFLLKYPEDPLVIRAKARLREAQEILAQGEFETANFYEMRGAYRAARGRYKEIIEGYPNFSEGDQALFGMAQTLEHLKTPKEAAPYYSRLVRDFPLSPRVDEAKARLVALGQPIPKPTRATLARAEADAARLRSKSLLEKLAMAMAGTPDTSTTLRGPVELGGGQASGIEMAKRVPTTTIPNASIIAQPVGDSNLTSEKAEEIKSATDSSSKGTSAEATENRPTISANDSSLKAPGNNASPSGNPGGPKAQETQASSSSSNQTSAKAEESNAKSTSEDQSGNNTASKKKGRFHILKKIIKPI